MVTKRDLGVSYLLGTGLGLIATLTLFFVLSGDVDLGLVIAAVMAAILSGTFVFIGYWMYHTGISGDTIWTVAKWSSLGLSVPVLIGLVLMQMNPDSLFRTIVPGIYINLIAVGGVVGLLVGLIFEMHREQSDLRELNQRNRVLNRVLRHNIRNDMSVMQLHVDLLEENENGYGSLDALQRKIDEVVSTSDMARQIDELDSTSSTVGPVDVVPLVKQRIDTVRHTHPDVTVHLDGPEEARANVGPVIETAIDNIVENAIEHHDGDPSIEIAVEPSAGSDDPVCITIADDGPGIPDDELEIFQNGERTQLEHGNGLGLWLVKWIVDHVGGDVRIETPDPGGTKVMLEVPPATAQDKALQRRNQSVL